MGGIYILRMTGSDRLAIASITSRRVAFYCSTGSAHPWLVCQKRYVNISAFEIATHIKADYASCKVNPSSGIYLGVKMACMCGMTVVATSRQAELPL